MIDASAVRTLAPALLMAPLLLASCGGGGASATGRSALPFTGSAGQTVTTAGQTAATVMIDIPPKRTGTAARRNAAYVSPSIQSIVITAAGGGTTTANLSAGSAGCSSQTPVIAQYAIPNTDVFNPNGSPLQITLGPDGNMWFVSDATSGTATGWLYKVTPAGVFSQFEVRYGSKPDGIVAGADGRLWTVADSNTPLAGANAAVTTSGTVSLYSPPNTGPAYLPQLTGVASANGLVYFGVDTYSAVYKTGTVDAAGNVNYLANTSPTNDFKPRTTGPDGAVWGLAGPPGGSQMVGKLSGGSTPVFYDVGYQPYDLAPGPDGNMWFTATLTDSGNRAPVVGHVSTSGTNVMTFAAPAGMAMGSLAAGPDGNMWFAESQANTIARVTTNGAITEFGVPYSPQYVAAGADGNVWFTEIGSGNGFIGKITPPGTECTVTVNVPLAVSPSGTPVATTVTAKAYDGLNGSGSVLGVASMPFTATAAGPNTIDFTLNGVVANVHVVAPAGAALTMGTPNSIPLSVFALDAQGNTIIAPGSYVDANNNALTIQLTDSDASGATAVQNPTISAPGGNTNPTLTYTGTGAVTATISATITGGTIAGTVTGTSLTSH